jgi:hypothetical protein
VHEFFISDYSSNNGDDYDKYPVDYYAEGPSSGPSSGSDPVANAARVAPPPIVAAPVGAEGPPTPADAGMTAAPK